MSDTWAGVVNPELTKLNPTKHQLEASLEFVDGHYSFTASHHATYSFNNKGFYCNIYPWNNKIIDLKETSCSEEKKVLCQFDCQPNMRNNGRIKF